MNPNVPYLHEADIERQASELIQEYLRDTGHTLDGVYTPVEEILETYLGLSLDFDNLAERLQIPDVLGATWVETGKIFIDQSLDPDENPKNEGRYHFTLAHEVGHWILHQPLLTKFSGQVSLFGPKLEPTIVCRTSQKKDPMEWQADTFASYLLMPKEFVLKAWVEQFGSSKPQVISIVDEFTQREHHVTSPMASVFKVSQQAMRIRLEKLGLLQYESQSVFPDFL